MTGVYINPRYCLINKKNCSYIVSATTPIHKDGEGMSGFVGMLPPMIGFILYNIECDDLEVAEKKIADITSLRVSVIDKFVRTLIDNPKQVGWNYKEQTISFPPYFLMHASGGRSARKVQMKDFSPFDDFVPQRPDIPFSVNFMITTKCHTNCIYCYADRNRKDDLSVSEILHVLDDAYKNGVINLTLTGGDIFAFPRWRDIIDRISQYNYSPVLSTKVPLSKEDISFLHHAGIRYLQISLDSVNTETLSILLRVDNDYCNKICDMIEYCNEVGIKINIRTVLTKYNATIAEMGRLYDYITAQRNIVSWILTPAFYSAFKTEYESYRPCDEELISVYNFIQHRQKEMNYPLQVGYNKMNGNGYKLQLNPDVDSFVKNNPICHANTYSMAILSNGLVTICEMLYDSPHFILGNIREQSLHDVWNSPKALNLFAYQQEMILHKKDNPCVTCKVFDKCKSGFHKRICYSDIVKVYGNNKFEYPDPRCPQALPIQQNMIL